MHMQGDPPTVTEARTTMMSSARCTSTSGSGSEAAELAEIDPERIAVDPGSRPARDLDHNLELMHGVDAFLDLGRPVVVGPSRKRFIGTILDLPEEERVEGTVGAVVWMVARGATPRPCARRQGGRPRGPGVGRDREGGRMTWTEKRRAAIPDGELALVDAGTTGRRSSCCCRGASRPPICGAG